MGNLTYSKGISWIDDCRIPFVDEKVVSKKYNDGYDTFTTYLELGDVKTDYNIETNTLGRFPANILVSDDMLNDGIIKESKKQIQNHNSGGGIIRHTKEYQTQSYSDKGTNSRYYDIDKWFEKLLND